MNEQYFTELNGYLVKDNKAIHTYDTVASMKADNKLKSGMYIKTKGYYSINDGGNAEYYIRTKTNQDIEDNGSIHVIDNLVAELIVSDNVNIKQFGAKGDNLFDNYSCINACLNYAVNNGLCVIVPKGIFITSQGFDVQKSLTLKGVNQNESIIKLVSDTPDILLNIRYASKFYNIENITLDGNDKTHTGIRIAGNMQSIVNYGTNWKNYFQNCNIFHFDIGLIFTTDNNVLDGSTMAFASENMFLHCKFKHNHTHIVQENTQSFNNSFYQTDLENDESDTDDKDYPMIINKAGGYMNFDTCSLIGAGMLYYINTPDNSNLLLQESWLSVQNCRIGMREGHQGNLIYQDSATNLQQNYQKNYINMNNVTINKNDSGQNQTLNLINYIGRIFVNINALNLVKGEMNVVANSLQGVSNNTFKTESVVNLTNINGHINYVYGDRTSGNESYTGNFNFQGITNNYDNTPSDGFRDYSSIASQSKYGYNLNNAQEHFLACIQEKPEYANDNNGFILPKGMFLTKLCFFKQGTRRTQDLTVNLYMVKDKSNWAGSTFDLSTDGVLIASLTDNQNKTGYFETNISYSENYGNDVRTGKISGFEEGRYYIQTTPNNVSGVIGIKYI